MREKKKTKQMNWNRTKKKIIFFHSFESNASFNSVRCSNFFFVSSSFVFFWRINFLVVVVDCCWNKTNKQSWNHFFLLLLTRRKNSVLFEFWNCVCVCVLKLNIIIIAIINNNNNVETSVSFVQTDFGFDYFFSSNSSYDVVDFVFHFQFFLKSFLNDQYYNSLWKYSLYQVPIYSFFSSNKFGDVCVQEKKKSKNWNHSQNLLANKQKKYVILEIFLMIEKNLHRTHCNNNKQKRRNNEK